MANRELSRIFSELALYLEMDSIPFKPRSYEKAAEALNVLSDEAEEIYQKEGRKGLEGIPGVGKGIAEKIAEYLETGKIHELEQYRKKMPTDIEKLTLVEGIGPKMVKELWGYLKIKNLKDLEKAARAGRVAGIPGFGPKKEQNILQGIGFLKKS